MSAPVSAGRELRPGTSAPTAASIAPGLQDKVVFVTGGGRGLGAAISNALGATGARIVVADLNDANAQSVAAAIEGNGGRARAVALDIGDEDAVRTVIDGVVEGYGRLDVLINNAGIDFTLPLEELSVAQWDAVMRTNLRGPFLLSKYAVPVMRR